MVVVGSGVVVCVGAVVGAVVSVGLAQLAAEIGSAMMSSRTSNLMIAFVLMFSPPYFKILFGIRIILGLPIWFIIAYL